MDKQMLAKVTNPTSNWAYGLSFWDQRINGHVAVMSAFQTITWTVGRQDSSRGIG